MLCRDNAERTSTATAVLQIHAVLSENDPAEAEQTLLVDLLADLLHGCSKLGIDFDQCLATARMHFEEECQEQPG